MTTDTYPPGLKPWLIFDCETTGLPLRSKKGEPPIPADAPGQPRLAAIAMIWASPALAVTAKKRWYVKPDGWKMEPGATAVNGLTDEFLRENGMPVSEVLNAYERAIAEQHIFSAFNVQFDAKIMRGELRRAGRPDHREDTPTVCAMLKSAGVVKAKKKDGTPKPPKLDEALAHFKIDRLGQSHTATSDAHAVLSILRFLSQIGIDLTPSIVRSNSHPSRAIEKPYGERRHDGYPGNGDELPIGALFDGRLPESDR
jgi:DNA polymerase III subunit epsilon